MLAFSRSRAYYGGIWFFGGVFFNLMWLYAARRSIAADERRRIDTMVRRAWIFGPIAYALLTLLAPFAIWLSLAGFVLIAIAYSFPLDEPRVFE